MSCLLCLRNEGIQNPDESRTNWEILLDLFKLPSQLFRSLEGNECCSLCRVKLQFVAVINQEMEILNQKLKCFQHEVKQTFVSSFNGCEDLIKADENEQMPIQTRRILLNELRITSIEEDPTAINEEFQFNSEQQLYEASKIDPEIIIPDSDTFQPQDPIINYIKIETPENDVFESNEYVIEAVKGEDETTINPHSMKYAISQPKPNEPQQHSLTTLMSQRLRQPRLTNKLKHEKTNKFQKPNDTYSNSSGSNIINRKARKITCSLCKTNEEFQNFDEYLLHLQTVHPSRPFSKCPTCHRIVLERYAGSNTELKNHIKQVHQERQFTCEECGKSFKTPRHLTMHYNCHSLNKESVSCHLCNAIIKGHKKFKRHLTLRHHVNPS